MNPKGQPMRAWILALAYVSTVVLANVLTSNLGLVAAGFTLLVPAGTYTAGLALGVRDGLQEVAGIRWTLAGIAAGTALSYLFGDGRIAIASGLAFLVSELADLGVYTPLRDRGRWVLAVVVSNLVGAVIDTMLFLPLSGLPWNTTSVAGQLLVKFVYCTAVYLAVRWAVVDRAVSRQRKFATGA